MCFEFKEKLKIFKKINSLFIVSRFVHNKILNILKF